MSFGVDGFGCLDGAARPVLAQSNEAANQPAAQPVAAPEPDAAQGSDLGLNEIIVTGTRTGTRKFDTSYAITTIDPQAIAQKRRWALRT